MEEETRFLISEKYAFFLSLTGARFEFLEGPSATAKTTIGAYKFTNEVRLSSKKLHVITGLDTGTIQKNIILSDFGLMRTLGKRSKENPNGIEFHPNGQASLTIPHFIITGKDGQDKIILIVGYDTDARWKKILGGQYGCVFLDEMVIAPINFIRQIFMRADYVLGTSNPNNPDLPVYKEYVNRCRPMPQCVGEAPAELEECLIEPAEEGWIHWYFGLDDNIGLSIGKKEKIIKSHTPGTADYMYFVQGIRGKAEGVIFDNFDRNKNIISEKDIIKKVQCQFVDYKKENIKIPDEKFIAFSAGLDTAYSSKSDDTIAFSFIGITNQRNLYILDEEVYNNKDSKIVYAPSNIVEKYYSFLEKNRNKWGFALNVFVDSADQATLSEFRILKAKKGLVYNFNDAYKKIKIIDRIQLQKGWIATDNFFVLNNCKNYIHELQVYRWSDKPGKTEPEDANDHMINSVQYAWIPFKDKIGTIQGD